MPKTRLALAAVTSLLLSGCKPDAAVRTSANLDRDSAVPASTTTIPVDPATAGTLSGTVHLDGKAPAPVRIDMSQDPVCSMTGGTNVAEQIVASSGRLANVFISITAGPAAAMNATPPTAALHTTLDQKGCRYTPHVVAVEHGGSVTFLNSDSTMHNIHTMPTVVGNETIDVSQGPHGEPQTRRFDHPEAMMPVRCNNHPWMNAFLNIAPTPYFAITGADGTFTIPNLPAGDYTITAVQEKLGTQTAHVTVLPHATATADFTYKAPK